MNDQEFIEAINRIVVLARQHGEEEADRSDGTTAELMDAMYDLLDGLGMCKSDWNVVFEDELPQFEAAEYEEE